ncbi:MAG: TIGR00282 family metallophosphoesterase [Candidatus Krumholzibacteria bacterium]|nr:TIGR00282 family metallophosphoesterase [Candidatus Krumholzibacteria bacterium]MDP6669169.1 TIGR00282 family metallophosphoesterase [Candidatus Krumholzibacteria bacterium]MDP6797405.1 TIGR00282 family metallophosphoesterase [Candidatus Krumholzibacteria bacterium]MDP7020863.1 TIGR00282 family metallophosphoesterase [Candidatus Krumholzibacteria bacterium]
MRVLFLADIMGSPGRKVLRHFLPLLIDQRKPDLVIANAENAAGGGGLTRSVAREIFDAGAQVLTGGNHSWDQKEGVALLDEDDRVLRPHNYPEDNPGSGLHSLPLADGQFFHILNLQGRVFMQALSCPFRLADKVLAKLEGPVFVDIHAEASSEKVALARYLDGRVSAVIGTHTHVQTSDARILQRGTAFLCDAGMTGPHDSVIGMKEESVLPRFLLQTPHRFEVAKGGLRLQGVLLDIDLSSAKALSIETVDLPLEDSP